MQTQRFLLLSLLKVSLSLSERKSFLWTERISVPIAQLSFSLSCFRPRAIQGDGEQVEEEEETL